MNRIKNRKGSGEGQNFWQSYSDMMAALLLVFVLIIVVSITMMKSAYEKSSAELEAARAEQELYQEQIDEQKKVMEEQQEQLDKIVGVRSEIIEQLKQAFEDSDMGIKVDPESGAISFDSSILFDYNKDTLKSSGQEFLDEFFPQYYEILSSEDIFEYIAEIIIEGHTDDNGGYLYNLKLSQQRAYAVAEYCLKDDTKMFSGDELEKARELVTSNGRAYFELIEDENGKVDAEASRRVEVKFRLTEDEMIEELSKLLEN